MSNLIEVQGEFELLIKELERLKSINEMTSFNSTNAKKTIAEIKSFVNSVEKFKSKIEEDYSSKKSDLLKVEKTLQTTLDQLVKSSLKQNEQFEKFSTNHSTSVQKAIDTLKKDWDTRSKEYSNQLRETRSVIEKDISGYLKVTQEQQRSFDAQLGRRIESSFDLHLKELRAFEVKSNRNTDIIRNKLVDFTSEITKEISNIKKNINILIFLVIGIGVSAALGFAFILYMY